MYDDTCRFLAEHFSADFASWLLGEPVTLTELKPSELSLEPHHEFDVIRLWEQPASRFLQYPGLLPFAALGQSENPAEMLRQATQMVDQIAESTTQANLMAASAILAGLRLEETVIYQLVRRDIMQESVIYRSIQKEKTLAIARNLLQGGVAPSLIASATGLSLDEVQQLQQQINEVSQTVSQSETDRE